MSIPVYRHNQNHDDWELASVYDSDECDSLGRSAYNESLHSSSPSDDPTLHLQGHLYDDTRPHVRYSVPASYLQGTSSRPRWDAPRVPGKQSRFIVPPPGVIFPSNDRLPPPQDTPPVNAGLIEPPPLSLLLSPSSPPRTPSPLIGLPSPTTTIAHGHLPHATTGMGTNVNGHVSTMIPHPPRYPEVVHNTSIPPRLAEAGCQGHPGMVMSPPRKSGHDVLSPSPSYTSGAVLRAQSNEEMTIADGRYGGASYGPGDRPDLHPLSSKYEREHELYEGGRGRTRWSQSRERRPSIWRRFVRRFSPSHVSVGQT
ncbi:hypothetical protein JVT61DRAFT_15294 [Boletus reticuloceps]|uniref:Uncharacterized protein n=1 Tax=Boletus reticuloceps TaxID=495285 RepID=A0A8I2YSH0_9AGAM|nr:hypothetical protein JVT61DRAFT_15294 [Boletus reticuloceps]